VCQVLPEPAKPLGRVVFCIQPALQLGVRALKSATITKCRGTTAPSFASRCWSKRVRPVYAQHGAQIAVVTGSVAMSFF